MPDETNPSETRLPTLQCPHCGGRLDMRPTPESAGAADGQAHYGLVCVACNRVITGRELEHALVRPPAGPVKK